MNKLTPSVIVSIIALFFSTGLMIFLFSESREDPSLRIAALVAGTNLVASLASIASTLLTGKDVTTKATEPAPPPTPPPTPQEEH